MSRHLTTGILPKGNLSPFDDDGNYIAAFHTRYGITKDASNLVSSFTDQTDKFTCVQSNDLLKPVENGNGIVYHIADTNANLISNEKITGGGYADATIEFHIKPNNETNFAPISNQWHSGGYNGAVAVKVLPEYNPGILIYLKNGTTNVAIFGVSSYFANNTYLNYYDWNHIAVVIKGGNYLALYVNGILAAASNYPTVNSVYTFPTLFFQGTNLNMFLAGAASVGNNKNANFDRIYVSSVARYDGTTANIGDQVFNPPSKDD